MEKSFEFEGNDEEPVIGTPEGDGDFESDGRPSTGETSAGGQIASKRGEAAKTGQVEPMEPEQGTELEQVIDQVSSGKIIW